MKKSILVVSLCIASLLFVACGKPTEVANDNKDKLKIVATYSIVADMAENVVGEKGEVYSMVPIGTDPHSYDPTPQDSTSVEKADLILANGFNLEVGNGWFEKLVSNSNKTDSSFEVSEGVEAIHLSESGSEDEIDPHAWLNVENGIKYVENIAKRIIEKDPENEEYYTKNKDEYIAKLKGLDEEIKEKMSTIPEENRILVTSEGAFKYFSKQYGFQAEYIWEINTDTQGSPEQMTRIIDIVKTKNVKALFVETSISPKTMEAVSRETGVEIYGTIFTDSLGAKGEDGSTYYDMMKWNADSIYEGLK